MFRLYIIISLLFFSVSSFSHSGHDHTDPMSGLIHLLWIAPLFIGIAFIVHQLIKRSNFMNEKSKGDM
jgi:hypothetical protein